jgi:uncharacterized protein
MDISGFDWDDANYAKCQKHGVSIAVIEHLFLSGVTIYPDPAHSQTEERFLAIGQSSAGRAVLVVFALRRIAGGRFIRPISARYMHKKEAAHYAETYKT